ncbi:amino acid permease [Aureitalea marina]|uniref:Arginine/agmatine antiporter n=2 Tax=Aureitalea marina TaxID=930804 RepID=A0A2S7KTG7_9FLAO|nr:amino acid permease [Aureitalea marina]
MATALVVGNMIGVGIYLLPASLAGRGWVSVLGWVFTAAGALILARIFGKMSVLVPNKSGGPYAYTRAGFGDFMGFLIAWGYWITCWVGNAAIVIATVGALQFFFPSWNDQVWPQVLVGLGLLWSLTLLNSRGVRESGLFQVVTVIIKILPMIFVILIGAFYFSWDNFPPFITTGDTPWGAVAGVATLTLYAFLGLESASIPAAEVDNPEKNIPKATFYGTLASTVFYILGTIVLFGMLPWQELSQSTAPFADAAQLLGGEWSAYFVAAGAFVSGVGALNGWVLITAQVPLATAEDDLFPVVFKRKSGRGVPLHGLIIGSSLTSLLLLMTASDQLVEQFEFIGFLTVFTSLVPYMFVAAAYVLMSIDERLAPKSLTSAIILGSLGFAYTAWTIYGSGQEAVFYGFLLLMAGLPFYWRMRWNKLKRRDQEADKSR